MTSLQIYGVLLTPMQIWSKIEIIEGYAEFEDFSNTWCGIMNLPPRPRHFLARLPRWKLNKGRLNGIAFEYSPSTLYVHLPCYFSALAMREAQKSKHRPYY